MTLLGISTLNRPPVFADALSHLPSVIPNYFSINDISPPVLAIKSSASLCGIMNRCHYPAGTVLMVATAYFA
jgi:hypothetical protein